MMDVMVLFDGTPHKSLMDYSVIELLDAVNNKLKER